MSRSKVTLKIILLGDQGVGKTSILKRYIDNSFNMKLRSTIGADFCTKTIRIGGKAVTLQIWDTGTYRIRITQLSIQPDSKEFVVLLRMLCVDSFQFATVNKAYYRGADGVMIVYDLTLLTSFQNVPFWKRKFLENCASDFPNSNFTLVGNKVDSEQPVVQDVAQTPAVQKFLSEGAKLCEVSAKTGSGIRGLFLHVAERAYEKYMRDHAFEMEMDDIFQGVDISVADSDSDYEGLKPSASVVLPRQGGGDRGDMRRGGGGPCSWCK